MPVVGVTVPEVEARVTVSPLGSENVPAALGAVPSSTFIGFGVVAAMVGSWTVLVLTYVAKTKSAPYPAPEYQLGHPTQPTYSFPPRKVGLIVGGELVKYHETEPAFWAKIS